VTASATAVVVIGVAGYGLVAPAGTSAQAGLYRQVADGERISAASRLQAHAPRAAATRAPALWTAAPRTTAPPSAPGLPAHQARQQRVVKHARLPLTRPAQACRADGWQVTAIGDSVMLASASALEQQMPGIYLDAKVGRQMQTGVQLVQELAASGGLRHFVVVGLGTNGAISSGEIWQLREAAGPNRELILVNTFGPMSWGAEVNGVLATATWHKPHVQVANWAQAIAPRAYLLWSDGIHPQPSGAQVYARAMENAIGCR
jgi:hypothetical protein